MSEKSDFQPYTPQLGISGSSYQLQMGQVNGFWAIRLVKGTSVLASKVYNNEPNPEEIPLGRHLTGWVLSVLAIPNINTYQIQKVVGFLRQKAQENFEQQKRNRQAAGKSERTEVKLEKVPENVQIKRPQAKGWVKEEKTTQITEQEKQLSPALAASNRAASGKEPMAVSLRGKKLPQIPHGPSFIIKPLEGSEKQAISSGAVGKVQISEEFLEEKIHNLPELQQLLQRLNDLEERVHQLEKVNQILRKKLDV